MLFFSLKDSGGMGETGGEPSLKFPFRVMISFFPFPNGQTYQKQKSSCEVKRTRENFNYFHTHRKQQFLLGKILNFTQRRTKLSVRRTTAYLQHIIPPINMIVTVKGKSRGISEDNLSFLFSFFFFSDVLFDI